MYTLAEVREATGHFNWDTIYAASNGRGFPVVLKGEVVTATVVHTSEHDDSDYDNDIEVVVQIGTQYFKQGGYANSGSHCYGEYGNSWHGLTEVEARTKTITVYE